MLNVGILLFDQVELLDFAGPLEVFTTANRVAEKNAQPTPFCCQTLALSSHIKVRAGLTVIADQICDEFKPQLLLIPGGDTRTAQKDMQLLQWLKHAATRCQHLASVCTGVFLLAEADLLDERSITTHWEDIEPLSAQFPSLNIEQNLRFIDHGTFSSSAGISAGIDLALHLVAKFTHQELAQATARQMDYRANTRTKTSPEGTIYGLL